MRYIDADAVCERCRASGAICTGKDCEIPNMPTLTPPNEWVNRNVRLPEWQVDVLVLYDSGKIDINWVDSVGEFMDENIYGRVTHWMPLPAPPAGGS